jgi:hypothetical protein
MCACVAVLDFVLLRHSGILAVRERIECVHVAHIRDAKLFINVWGALLVLVFNIQCSFNEIILHCHSKCTVQQYDTAVTTL